MVGPRLGELEPSGTDGRCHFGVDESLQEHRDAVADDVHVATGPDHVEQDSEVSTLTGRTTSAYLTGARFG